MKKILTRIMSGKKQQGIALLFALAILSLLMVMALGFATSAIFEQKAAYNSANTSSARLMAQSALNRALVLVGTYGDTVQSSHDENFKDIKDKDMLDRLSMEMCGAPLYAWTAADSVTWEYITMDDGPVKRLLGRFAYKIIPIAGIDPGAIVAESVDESLNAEPRPGNNISEINIMSMNTADITAPIAKKFNYATCTVPGADGVYPGPVTGWQSFKNLFTLTGITDENLQSKLLRWFMLDTGRFKAKESYRIDPADPKYYHRFNLARTDWNTAFDTKEEMYEKILLDKNPTSGSGPDGIPDQLPLAYSTTAAAQDGYGIPWLAFFGYNADGTLDTTLGATFGNSAAGVIARRRQIAANLVDYCRADTALPTSDVDPATWYNGSWGAIPTFTGNKKTPYINEIGFHVMVEGMQTNVNGTNNKGKGKAKGKGKKNKTSSNILSLGIDINATVELADIYQVSLPADDSTVTLYYRISYDVTGAGATAGTVVSTGTTSFSVTKGNWGSGTPHNSYATPTGWPVDPFFAADPINEVSVSPGTVCSMNVNNISLQVRAVLNYGGKNYDYANINISALPVNITIDTDTTDTIDKDYYVTCQVNDPRQNLNPGDWTVRNSDIITDGSYSVTEYNTRPNGTKFGTLNAENTITFPTSDIDLESSPNKVANSSTAYIRNGPMQSPWELGLIHRGKAWETINLKEFDQSKNFTYIAGTPNIIPGGGAYADGDANILEQIKMDSNIDNFKVNINSVFQDPSTSKYTVLEALFAKIKTGCAASSPATAGTELTAAEISGTGGLIPTITTKTKSPLTRYTNRAQVVNDIVVALPISGYTTDAKKEELIGKFVNLTDIGGKFYYVIVLSQAIKDIGGTSTAINIKKTENGVSSTWPCKLGTFDFDKSKGIYFDEIIAEQKIKVLVYEPPFNGVPMILSYEFVE